MRHEDLLSRDRTVLVVIDVQERLMPVIVEKDRMVGNCVRLVKAAQTLEVPILVTEQNTKAFGRTVPPLAEALGKGAVPIEKMIFSACGVDSFRDALEKSGRRELLLCGIMTNVCVAQTALDAVSAGYTVHVAADAVTAGTAEDHRIGLDKCSRGGCIITTTESALFEMLERAGTDLFRAMLPLLKKG